MQPSHMFGWCHRIFFIHMFTLQLFLSARTSFLDWYNVVRVFQGLFALLHEQMWGTMALFIYNTITSCVCASLRSQQIYSAVCQIGTATIPRSWWSSSRPPTSPLGIIFADVGEHISTLCTMFHKLLPPIHASSHNTPLLDPSNLSATARIWDASEMHHYSNLMQK